MLHDCTFIFISELSNLHSSWGKSHHLGTRQDWTGNWRNFRGRLQRIHRAVQRSLFVQEINGLLYSMASLPEDEAEFTAYEKMPEDSNCWQSRKLDAIKKWVAMEKVHGANFSFTVSCGEREVRVAKRGGYLRKGESFFGVFRQKGFLETEQEKARELFAAVVKMDSGVRTITVYGELFGGMYQQPNMRFGIIGFLPLCSNLSALNLGGWYYTHWPAVILILYL